MDFNLINRHLKDERVMLAGDWHGQALWAQKKIAQAAKEGVSLILHVGDFNVWPGARGKKYLLEIERACATHNVDILVTPGNHEDWGRLTMLWDNPRHQDENGRHQPLGLFTEHVRILPRGYRFSINDVSFVSFGGAASVDFDVRTKDRDWWVEELYSWADVEEVSAGGYADIMITHETPNPPYAVPKVKQIIASNPMGFSREGLSYSAVSRNRLTVAMENVKPKLLAHGHMHVADEAEILLPNADYSTLVVSLQKDFEEGNTKIIDLEQFKEGLC